MRRVACSFDRLSVERYRSTHGRAPRGVGGWMFWLRRSGAYTQFEYSGSFSEAKAAAGREARALGCDSFGVAS